MKQWRTRTHTHARASVRARAAFYLCLHGKQNKRKASQLAVCASRVRGLNLHAAINLCQRAARDISPRTSRCDWPLPPHSAGLTLNLHNASIRRHYILVRIAVESDLIGELMGQLLLFKPKSNLYVCQLTAQIFPVRD